MSELLSEFETLDTLILAGGAGTRLRAIIQDQQKVFIQVNGRPFLTYLLDMLVNTGLKRTILCTGHRGDALQATLGDHYGRLQLEYSQEDTPLGTAGALKQTLPLLHSRDVLVLNGDSYCEVNLKHFYANHAAHDAVASIVLVRVQDTSRYGRVELNNRYQITRFVEKGVSSEPGWVNAGIYLLNRQVLESIPDGRIVSIENEIFPALLKQKVIGYQTEGRFLDIGTPESFSQAAAFLSSLQRMP
jgi:D-glycero-alpha-D-manno-heptose 1-phosphate guanylyltransferase